MTVLRGGTRIDITLKTKDLMDGRANQGGNMEPTSR